MSPVFVLPARDDLDPVVFLHLYRDLVGLGLARDLEQFVRVQRDGPPATIVPATLERTPTSMSVPLMAMASPLASIRTWATTGAAFRYLVCDNVFHDTLCWPGKKTSSQEAPFGQRNRRADQKRPALPPLFDAFDAEQPMMVVS